MLFDCVFDAESVQMDTKCQLILQSCGAFPVMVVSSICFWLIMSTPKMNLVLVLAL